MIFFILGYEVMKALVSDLAKSFYLSKSNNIRNTYIFGEYFFINFVYKLYKIYLDNYGLQV